METKIIKIEGTAEQIQRGLEILKNREVKWTDFDTSHKDKRILEQKDLINKLNEKNNEQAEKLEIQQDVLNRRAADTQRQMIQQHQQKANVFANTSVKGKAFIFDVITSASALDTGREITEAVTEKNEKGYKLIELLQTACTINHTEPYIITTLIYETNS